MSPKMFNSLLVSSIIITVYGEMYNIIQYHGGQNSSIPYKPIRHRMYCSLLCTNDQLCVAFDVCVVQHDVTCALLQSLSSLSVKLSAVPGNECTLFEKVREDTCTSGSSNAGCSTSAVTQDVTVTSVTCNPSYGYKLVENLNMCYKVNFTRSTWITANETCVAEGARLLMVHNEERWQFWNATAPIIDDLFYGFWIGGNDLEVEGQWTWSDGSLFTDHTFMKWGKMYSGVWKYEPDNYGGKDNCLRFYKAVHPHFPSYPETEYTWHDDWCAVSFLYFICEIPME